MTSAEISLLLYLEARGVDFASAVDTSRINKEDLAIMKRWCAEDYIRSGRIRAADIKGHCSMWCCLSEDAIWDAHKERLERAQRKWKERPYKTTEEARG